VCRQRQRPSVVPASRKRPTPGGKERRWPLASFLLAGVAAEFFTVVWETVNYTHIPERLLSRVGSPDEFWSIVSLPLGQLSAPVLAATFGTGTVAVTGGAIAAAAMLSASLVPSLRRIEIN
jgi:hypothetical protein